MPRGNGPGMELKDIDFEEEDFAVDLPDKTEEKTNYVEYEYDDDSDRTRRKPLFVVLLVIAFLLTSTLVAILILYAGRDLFIREEEQAEEIITEETPIYTQTDVDKMIEDAVNKASEEKQRETEDVMKKLFRQVSEEDNGVLMMLREYNPDDMIFITGSKYEYYPINRNLAPNTVDNSLLTKDATTGIIAYTVDDVEKSHICIDVSSFQKEINWDKVKASGVEYALIRCGFRGYGTGKIVEDTYFISNIEEATSAGIKVGVYFFTQAVDEEEAIAEAEYVLDLISPYDVELPIAIDIEEISDKARTDELTNEERTKICLAFMDKVKEAGYEPMIYSNLKFFIKMLDMDKLEGYEKWFAFYNDTIYFPYEIGIWQYSANGKVDGIKTDVDLNIALKDW